MIHYGIELEFFITNKDGEIIPAYKATQNLDGNPIIGELKTKVHNNINDCVFELKKLIYEETNKLKNLNYFINFSDSFEVNDNFLKNIRKDSQYTNRKELDTLETYSVYGNNTGKILRKNLFKTSLQLNISSNNNFCYTNFIKEKDYYIKNENIKNYSEIFNYIDIIKHLDILFYNDIKNSKRVKGVYSIKKGELGNRIEYRSLPNSINIDSLLSLNDYKF